MLNPINFLKKQGESLLKFEDSEVLQSIDSSLEKGNQLLDDVNEKYKRDPITIDQYLKNVSPSIDEQIKNYCQRQNMQSLGGELIFKGDTNDKIHIQYDCYYKDMTGKIIKTSSEKRLDKDVFTAESLQTIIDTSPKYPIDPPK